jgi:hypothetical protein
MKFANQIRCAVVSLCVLVGASVYSAMAQSWTNLKGPSIRTGSSAVLDPTSGRMIVFAGQANKPGGPNLNEVWWLLNPDGPGLGWIRAQTKGTKPAPRVESSAVYDAVNDRMIIFGGALGHASPCSNDVWVLNHASGVTGAPTWIQLSPSGGPPAARLGFSAVYDPGTNTMIIYGGNDCFSTNYSDVWILSNANGLGTPTWTQLSPSGGSPGAREDHTAVYNPGSNSMVVFGGSSSSGNDTWVLSNANGTGMPAWTQLSPTGGPPPGRDGHNAIFDQANNRMTIYGGNNTTGILSDTWVLSNADGTTGQPGWTQIGPLAGAPARTMAAAVYNSTANKMTIFGGNPTQTEVSNSVFVLSKANGLP